MKKLLLSLFCMGTLPVAFGATHLVQTTGSNTFNPATTSAAVGDTVAFAIGSAIHNATTVTQAAWNANQGSPTTGVFAYTFPGNFYIVPAPMAGTTIYFVCTNHVGTSGMKGQINVAPVGTSEVEAEEWALNAYPNPAENFININSTGNSGKVNVHVLNLLGAEVLPMATVDVANYKINLTSLSEGTYFIRVENGDRTKVIRFMKK